MKAYVNLLPPNVQRRELLRRSVRLWIAPWVGAALVLAAAGGIWLRYDVTEAALAQSLDRQHERAELLEASLLTVRGEIAELERQVTADRPLEDPTPGATAVGIVSQATRKLAGELHVEHLAFETREPAGLQPVGDTADANSMRRILAVRGVALEGSSVVRLAAALRETGAFAAVEVKSVAAEPNDAGLQHYVLECTM